MLNFEEATKTNSQAIDAALKSYSDAAKGVQAIAAETAGFSKKSIEDAVSHVQTLSSTKSLEAAFALQSNFAKSCYENFVAEATRIGDLYAGIARAVYTPYEAPASHTAEKPDGATAAAA
jgi:phasin family protein